MAHHSVCLTVMPSRRNVLIAGGCLGVSSLAGCLDILRDDPSVREVNVLFENGGDASQTFRFALETDERMLEWESRTLDPESSETETIDLPTDSKPVAFHGTINDRERTLDFDNLDTSKDEVCLYLYFRYQSFSRDEIVLTRDSDTECSKDQ